MSTEKNVNDFSEQVEVLKTKKRRVGGLPQLIYSLFTGDSYECRNCRSYGVEETISTVRVRRIPDPAVFGEEAKPYEYTEERKGPYSCTKCGIEHMDLDRVAKSLVGLL